MAAESHAISVDMAQRAQAENLESARIRQHWTIPGHKAVQPTHLPDKLIARTHVQVICICKHQCRAKLVQFTRLDSFHRGLRAHRRKYRSRQRAVWRLEHPGPGSTACCLKLEPEHSHLTRRTREIIAAERR